jgi:hypothetical protein
MSRLKIEADELRSKGRTRDADRLMNRREEHGQVIKAVEAKFRRRGPGD